MLGGTHILPPGPVLANPQAAGGLYALGESHKDARREAVEHEHPERSVGAADELATLLGHRLEVLDEVVNPHARPVVEVAVGVERRVVYPKLLQCLIAEPPILGRDALQERHDDRLQAVVLHVVRHRDGARHALLDLRVAVCVG